MNLRKNYDLCPSTITMEFIANYQEIKKINLFQIIPWNFKDFRN